jgi:hypothetical protein
MPVLERESAHGLRTYVGRIRNDQIVACTLRSGEHVGLYEPDPASQAILRDVALRDFEGAAIDIERIDTRLLKRFRH